MRRRTTTRALLVAGLVATLFPALPIGPDLATPASAAAVSSPILAPFRVNATVGDTWGGADGYHPDDGKAIDFLVSDGTSIYAAGDGYIENVRIQPTNCNPYDHGSFKVGYAWCEDNVDDDGRGTFISIRHPDGRTSEYAHLSNVKSGLANGQAITAGAFIAYSGNSGISTAAHLHYAERTGGYNGTNVNPGFMDVCVDGSKATYPAAFGSGITDWPQADATGKTVLSENYSCIINNTAGSGSPIGTLDKTSSPEPGRISVAGWAFDADKKTTPVAIHAYVGGTAGAAGAEGHNLGLANGTRTDVGDAYPGVGDNHGFTETFSTSKVGSQTVYVYAIDLADTPGSNVLLGKKTINIANPSPMGTFDGASSPLPGKIRIRGWAFDPSERTAPIAIHAYVGGVAGAAGAEGHNLGLANTQRIDVGNAYPGVGDFHGFDITFSTDKVGSQKVYVYGIDIADTPGSNIQLGVRTIDVTPTDCGAGATGPFTDIAAKHLFCEEIEWSSFKAIDSGYLDGTFRPNDPNTRAMLAAQLYNYSGKPTYTPPTTSPFSDVPTSHPQYKQITWLASTGITAGYADNTFRPNDSVSRGSMAAFYYRLDGRPAFTPPTASPFSDVPKTHTFYKEITWLASSGVTTGYSDETFKPGAVITRQAMAAFLFRYDEI